MIVYNNNGACKKAKGMAIAWPKYAGAVPPEYKYRYQVSISV